MSVNTWTKIFPKPPGQDWYWWRPFPDGAPKVIEIYYTGREQKAGWIMCHPYGEMPISIVLQRWPHSEWSSMPIARPGLAARAGSVVVRGMTNDVREALMGARKWLMRIHHRKGELPPGFMDGCDPKPLADDIARLLSPTATTSPTTNPEDNHGS